MLGVFYILLMGLTGFSFITLVIPQAFSFTDKTYTRKKLTLPGYLFVVPVSFVVGTLMLAWPTYFLAYFTKTHTQINPLALADLLVMILASCFVAITLYLRYDYIKEKFINLGKYTKLFDVLFVCGALLFVTYLMFLTLNYKNGNLRVGVSVYSDFATHIGMIRSFSTAENFPTTYSHFAGVDLKYHFMFQFLVGNLEFLGMRIDLAFNIASIIYLVFLCSLLYVFAVKLFGRRLVGALSVFIFLFRSGSAFTTYIASINGTFKEILEVVKTNTEFIGLTEHENWGLWNLNVYANQRHLAFGLCVAMIAVMVMVQSVFDARKNKSNLFKANNWLPKKYKQPILIGLLLGLASFFNGACVIGALLILFILAFAADRKLEYLITAVITVVLTSMQTNFFVDGSVVDFRWQPGFLADVKTFFGTCDYLVKLLGILPFVLIIASIFVNGHYRWILLAFTTPIIFACCFQMTPDVAVNHKYIMLACMFLSVFAASLLYMIGMKRGIYNKIVAICLLIALTITGIYDFETVIKKNKGYIELGFEDPVTVWVMENSDADDIFLSDWYSLNNVVFGGGMLYFGWPYYAWSAGYDTDYRGLMVKSMYEANDPDTLDFLVKQENIRFIICDNATRFSGEYRCNEQNIARTYQAVYTQGEGDWLFTIYDTEKRLN